MNLLAAMAMSVKVGDPVTVDGLTSRATVVRKNGRRVTVQVQDWRGGVGYQNGYRLERDEASVHKLGKGPGDITFEGLGLPSFPGFPEDMAAAWAYIDGFKVVEV